MAAQSSGGDGGQYCWLTKTVPVSRLSLSLSLSFFLNFGLAACFAGGFPAADADAALTLVAMALCTAIVFLLARTDRELLLPVLVMVLHTWVLFLFSFFLSFLRSHYSTDRQTADLADL